MRGERHFEADYGAEQLTNHLILAEGQILDRSATGPEQVCTRVSTQVKHTWRNSKRVGWPILLS